MSSKEHLKVRSHFNFLAGLLLACVAVFFLEGMSKKSESQIGQQGSQTLQSLREKPGSIKNLTSEDLDDARIAWSYFEKNYQPETGLVNSVDKYPASSIWDTGSYIYALISARELQLIDDPTFDERLSKLLTSLSKITLFEDKLPNKSYNTKTLAMVDYTNKPSQKGIGWSALDVSRILGALYVVRRDYPIHGAAVEDVLERWKLGEAIKDGELVQANVKNGKVQTSQEGRLGYAQYAARNFQLYGLPVDRADRWDFHRSEIDVHGVKIAFDDRAPADFVAQNFVLSEPYVMAGLEFGLTGDLKTEATQVLAAQESRYEKDGILTACSESNLDKKPYFSYFCVYNDGKTWVCANHDGPIGDEFKTFTTSSGFAWSALFDTPYTQLLLEKARSLKRDEEKGGFFAGYYEATGDMNKTSTSNGNGLILESLLYKERGPIIAERAAK